MRKNSVKYLERLVIEEMNKYRVALKDFRFRERGIEKIVNDVIPKDADTVSYTHLTLQTTPYE